ncbi:hypothetical protein V6Z11_D03G116100 [Gossypium hirsutum]
MVKKVYPKPNGVRLTSRFLYIFSIRLYLKTGRGFNGHSTTIFAGKVIRSPRKRRIFFCFGKILFNIRLELVELLRVSFGKRRKKFGSL